MSKKISETTAGRWFLDEANLPNIRTDNIPKKVLISLSKLDHDELEQLADDVCWVAYWFKFQEYLFEMPENADKDDVLINDDDFPEYMEKYSKENFGCYDCHEEMVCDVATKFKTLLDLLIFWAHGLFVIKDHFDLFEVAEKRVMLDASSNNVRRNSIKCLSDETKEQGILSNKNEEVSSFFLIKEAIKNKNIDEARKLIENLKRIKDRMT
jgi:hypothetical protein